MLSRPRCGPMRRRTLEEDPMPTLSIIKADTGGFVGHTAVHQDILAIAARRLEEACRDGLLIDGQAQTCGDDLSLIMTHDHGRDANEAHGFAWDTFTVSTEEARRTGLYGVGQDLLSDAFSGDLRGMGPGYAELASQERASEPVICFLADETEPGVWNPPVYRMFADPFSTPRARYRPQDARRVPVRGARPLRGPAGLGRLPGGDPRPAAVHRCPIPLRDQERRLPPARHPRGRDEHAASGCHGRPAPGRSVPAPGRSVPAPRSAVPAPGGASRPSRRRAVGSLGSNHAPRAPDRRRRRPPAPA